MEDEQEAPGFGLPRDRGGARLNIRLLAVDLDGTLLNSQGQVHAIDRDAIRALAGRGVPTTIVTGRLYSGTRDAAEVIGTTGPVGCADGVHLVEAATGRDLYHGGIAGEHAARLRAVLAKVKPVSFLLARDQIVHDEQGAAHLFYIRTWSRDLICTENVAEHPHWEGERGITALVSIGTRAQIEAMHRELESALGGAAHLVSFPVRRVELDGQWALLARAAGHSKGTALAWLARHHGIETAEVAAVGDWFNDVPMFEVAGRSFAMAHAPDEVRRAATEQLRASVATGGGVAEAAARLGLL